MPNLAPLPLCFISSLRQSLPKQSQEIQCSTYFGLQEMRTPTSLGFSRKFPTDTLPSFIFHMKQCRKNHKTCSAQHAPSRAKTSPQEVPEAPHISAPPAGTGTHRPWYPCPCCDCPHTSSPVPGRLCGASPARQGASVVKSHQMSQGRFLQLGPIEYSLGTG